MNKRNSDPHHRNPALATGSLPLNNRKIHILWVKEGSIDGGGGGRELFWKSFVKNFKERKVKKDFIKVRSK